MQGFSEIQSGKVKHTLSVL